MAPATITTRVWKAFQVAQALLPSRTSRENVRDQIMNDLRGQLENVAHLFYFETKRVDICPAELGPCGQFGLDLNRLSYRVGGHLPIRHPLIPGVKFFANSLGASLQLPPRIPFDGPQRPCEV
jgi:hypothetical protein